ncbi:hypothetical protein GCM10007973_28080 [Polymorphobacter multimanifer]|uniref:Uncharacterized protein n=1 Tax=Polymorphobacter multimanifer TaxID=1070431 RepID=A0A841L4F9_9SPHN|nr:hypothetical protein [Polymorphobacter multimanifer]MBB6227739.1 hypothetical protein [Polymorphobacter multimanifer]GGI90138.1 hypothetical protein GCM10007973_28080 [Polymorphobacter multimanifer]
MRNSTSRQTDRQTVLTRIGSVTGFTLSGCFGAWAIVDAPRMAPLLIAAIVTFILGLVLARRATKTLYGR